MGKQSKWLKWKIGGGVIFSLAVVFNTAKADPAFEKAMQAAQDASNSSDIEDDVSGEDQEDYDDAPQDSDENEKEIHSHNDVAKGMEEPKPSLEVASLPVPQQMKKSTTMDHVGAQLNKKMAPPKKEGSSHKQIIKQVPKKASSGIPKSPKVEASQHAAPNSQVTSSPTENTATVPSTEVPADIPVVPPMENIGITTPVSSVTDPQAEANTQQIHTKSRTKKKKKSHSTSHHS